MERFIYKKIKNKKKPREKKKKKKGDKRGGDRMRQSEERERQGGGREKRPYHAVGGAWARGRSGVSSLLSGLYLRLEVGRRVKISTRIPCTLVLYIIHTHRHLVVPTIHRYIFRWVCVATVARLSWACTSLKFSTYLQRPQRDRLMMTGHRAHGI